MQHFDFTSIPQLRLSKGSHRTPQEGTCFAEALAFFSGEEHSDRPECACPVLTEYGIDLNDTMPDDVRNDLLIPMIGQVAGTRDPDSEQKRAEFLAMWAVNKIAPIELRAGGFEEHAVRCEQAKTLAGARAAAWAAAGDSAGDAADAAAYAARDADAYAAAYCAAIAAAGAARLNPEAWQVAVEGLRQAILIGRHDGLTDDPALKVGEFVKATQNA